MIYTQPAPLFDTAYKLRTGALNLEDYIHQTCAWMNKVESTIQSLIPEPNREQRLIQDARVLLNQYPDQASRPPLFGVLLGVKDIFNADGFPTRAGSKLPAEVFAGTEASSVSALRNAGAIILGKTVTTEFAYFAPGPTRNPNNPDYSPGGSSSGSAAAVAAGICSLSVGTQTIGSIIRPAAYCGIFGFKPSFGKIGTDGVLPCSQTVDHIGLFTQDIEGIAAAAAVLLPNWHGLPALDAGVCVGVPAGPYLEQADSAVRAAFEHSSATLAGAGFHVRSIPMFGNIETINAAHRQIVAAEFAENHTRLYAQHGHLYAPQSRELLEQGRAVTPDDIRRAVELKQSVTRETAETMRREGILAWLSPASLTPPPLGITSTGSPTMNLPWTFTGFPTIAVPAGKGKDNLPLSLQLAADNGEDASLIAVARSIHKILGSGSR